MRIKLILVLLALFSTLILCTSCSSTNETESSTPQAGSTKVELFNNKLEAFKQVVISQEEALLTVAKTGELSGIDTSRYNYIDAMSLTEDIQEYTTVHEWYTYFVPRTERYEALLLLTGESDVGWLNCKVTFVFDTDYYLIDVLWSIQKGQKSVESFYTSEEEVDISGGSELSGLDSDYGFHVIDDTTNDYTFASEDTTAISEEASDTVLELVEGETSLSESEEVSVTGVLIEEEPEGQVEE